MARIEHSQELDPLSLIINVAVGWALLHARRYEAIEQLRRTLELDPNYPQFYWILGLLLRKTVTRTGHPRGREGREAVRRQSTDTSALAHTLQAGRTKEALQTAR